MAEDTAQEQANRHIRHVRDFFYHLVVFVFVNTLMVVIDVRGGTGGQPVLGLDFAYWLIIFWGFGILGHAVYVFFGDDRVDRARSRRLDRDPGGHDGPGMAQ